MSYPRNKISNEKNDFRICGHAEVPRYLGRRDLDDGVDHEMLVILDTLVFL